jgi:hypothetical protein
MNEPDTLVHLATQGAEGMIRVREVQHEPSSSLRVGAKNTSIDVPDRMIVPSNSYISVVRTLQLDGVSMTREG